MAMNVTSSANSAKLQQTQHQSQQAAANKAKSATNKEQPAKQTQEAHKPEQPPKPVVNTQGQVTGKKINVTA